LDEHIQLHRLRPAGEYSVLTYAEWAEFDGNHVPLMGRIRIHMTLIKNELEPLFEGDDSTDPNLESEEDKKLQGKAEHQAEADPQREVEPQGNAEPHGEADQ
jgi:hypothetical protein